MTLTTPDCAALGGGTAAERDRLYEAIEQDRQLRREDISRAVENLKQRQPKPCT
jgi:hypothetical protein